MLVGEGVAVMVWVGLGVLVWVGVLVGAFSAVGETVRIGWEVLIVLEGSLPIGNGLEWQPIRDIITPDARPNKIKACVCLFISFQPLWARHGYQ